MDLSPTNFLPDKLLCIDRPSLRLLSPDRCRRHRRGHRDRGPCHARRELLLLLLLGVKDLLLLLLLLLDLSSVEDYRAVLRGEAYA